MCVYRGGGDSERGDEQGTIVSYEAIGREGHPLQGSCTWGDTPVMEWSPRNHRSTPMKMRPRV